MCVIFTFVYDLPQHLRASRLRFDGAAAAGGGRRRRPVGHTACNLVVRVCVRAPRTAPHTAAAAARIVFPPPPNRPGIVVVVVFLLESSRFTRKPKVNRHGFSTTTRRPVNLGF